MLFFVVPWLPLDGLQVAAKRLVGQTGFLHQSSDLLRRSSPTWPTARRVQGRINHCAGCTMGGGPRRQGPPINCQIFTTLCWRLNVQCV